MTRTDGKELPKQSTNQSTNHQSVGRAESHRDSSFQGGGGTPGPASGPLTPPSEEGKAGRPRVHAQHEGLVSQERGRPRDLHCTTSAHRLKASRGGGYTKVHSSCEGPRNRHREPTRGVLNCRRRMDSNPDQQPRSDKRKVSDQPSNCSLRQALPRPVDSSSGSRPPSGSFPRHVDAS